MVSSKKQYELCERFANAARLLPKKCDFVPTAFVEMLYIMNFSELLQDINALPVDSFIEKISSKHNGVLHYALEENNLLFFKVLLSKIDYPIKLALVMLNQGDNGCNVLHLAAFIGNESIARLLIESLHENDRQIVLESRVADSGGTALQLAAQQGYLGIVELLLNSCIEPEGKQKLLLMEDKYDGKDKYGAKHYAGTPLRLAIENDHVKVVVLLLENSTNPQELLEPLIISGELRGYYALYRVITKGKVDVLKEILNYINDRQVIKIMIERLFKGPSLIDFYDITETIPEDSNTHRNYLTYYDKRPEMIKLLILKYSSMMPEDLAFSKDCTDDSESAEKVAQCFQFFSLEFIREYILEDIAAPSNNLIFKLLPLFTDEEANLIFNEGFYRTLLFAIDSYGRVIEAFLDNKTTRPKIVEYIKNHFSEIYNRVKPKQGTGPTLEDNASILGESFDATQNEESLSVYFKSLLKSRNGLHYLDAFAIGVSTDLMLRRNPSPSEYAASVATDDATANDFILAHQEEKHEHEKEIEQIRERLKNGEVNIRDELLRLKNKKEDEQHFSCDLFGVTHVADELSPQTPIIVDHLSSKTTPNFDLTAEISVSEFDKILSDYGIRENSKPQELRDAIKDDRYKAHLSNWLYWFKTQLKHKDIWVTFIANFSRKLSRTHDDNTVCEVLEIPFVASSSLSFAKRYSVPKVPLPSKPLLAVKTPSGTKLGFSYYRTTSDMKNCLALQPYKIAGCDDLINHPIMRIIDIDGVPHVECAIAIVASDIDGQYKDIFQELQGELIIQNHGNDICLFIGEPRRLTRWAEKYYEQHKWMFSPQARVKKIANKLQALLNEFEKSKKHGKNISLLENSIRRKLSKAGGLEKNQIAGETLYETILFFAITKFEKEFYHYEIDRNSKDIIQQNIQDAVDAADYIESGIINLIQTELGCLEKPGELPSDQLSSTITEPSIMSLEHALQQIKRKRATTNPARSVYGLTTALSSPPPEAPRPMPLTEPDAEDIDKTKTQPAFKVHTEEDGKPRSPSHAGAAAAAASSSEPTQEEEQTNSHQKNLWKKLHGDNPNTKNYYKCANSIVRVFSARLDNVVELLSYCSGENATDAFITIVDDAYFPGAYKLSVTAANFLRSSTAQNSLVSFVRFPHILTIDEQRASGQVLSLERLYSNIHGFSSDEILPSVFVTGISHGDEAKHRSNDFILANKKHIEKLNIIKDRLSGQGHEKPTNTEFLRKILLAYYTLHRRSVNFKFGELWNSINSPTPTTNKEIIDFIAKFIRAISNSIIELELQAQCFEGYQYWLGKAVNQTVRELVVYIPTDDKEKFTVALEHRKNLKLCFNTVQFSIISTTNPKLGWFTATQDTFGAYSSVNMTRTETESYFAAAVVVTVFDQKTKEYYVFAVQELQKGGKENGLFGNIKAPGGLIDKQDKPKKKKDPSVELASLRELKEETGLDWQRLPEGTFINGNISLLDHHIPTDKEKQPNNKVAFVHLPLVTDDMDEFINQFRPLGTEVYNSELCGGNFCLIPASEIIRTTIKGSILDGSTIKIRKILDNKDDEERLIKRLATVGFKTSPEMCRFPFENSNLRFYIQALNNMSIKWNIESSSNITLRIRSALGKYSNYKKLVEILVILDLELKDCPEIFAFPYRSKFLSFYIEGFVKILRENYISHLISQPMRFTLANDIDTTPYRCGISQVGKRHGEAEIPASVGTSTTVTASQVVQDTSATSLAISLGGSPKAMVVDLCVRRYSSGGSGSARPQTIDRQLFEYDAIQNPGIAGAPRNGTLYDGFATEHDLKLILGDLMVNDGNIVAGHNIGSCIEMRETTIRERIEDIINSCNRKFHDNAIQGKVWVHIPVCHQPTHWNLLSIRIVCTEGQNAKINKFKMTDSLDNVWGGVEKVKEYCGNEEWFTSDFTMRDIPTGRQIGNSFCGDYTVQEALRRTGITIDGIAVDNSQDGAHGSKLREATTARIDLVLVSRTHFMQHSPLAQI